MIGGLPGNPSTNASGDYSAKVNYGWSGTTTPSKAGYTFAPTSRTYSNVTANQTAQSYTGTLQTFTISGLVTDGGGPAIGSVLIGGLPSNPSTNASGDYSATVNYGWSGTATPGKAGYAFGWATRAEASSTVPFCTAECPGSCCSQNSYRDSALCFAGRAVGSPTTRIGSAPNSRSNGVTWPTWTVPV